MDAVGGVAPSRFAERILRFLERVEHRCAATSQEKETVYKLRYEAYVRQGLIERRPDGRLYDAAMDDAPNAWITTTFIDGELASTVRVHAAAKEGDALPSLGVFSDVLSPHLKAGRMIVDPSRMAARLQFAGKYPELPYVTTRPGWMAAEHFGADFFMATVSEPHLAFYQRVFGYAPWCEARDYPNVTCKIVCLGLDFPAAKERVEARFPFFRSTPAEREALFGRLPARAIGTPSPWESRERAPVA